MSNRHLFYRIPLAEWNLEFCEDVLEVLERHVQRRWFSRESVGQLYARDLTSSSIKVELATVLKPTWASYARVRFDPVAVAAERAIMFERGFHCIGLWHSHPEPLPHPSSDDLLLAADHGRAARGNLSGLVFAIVGNSPFPSGLGVWVHDGCELWTAVLDAE